MDPILSLSVSYSCCRVSSCSLKGVPLAYDNIRILGQHGDIVDDSGYIHMDIIADFVIFQPQKGQKLLVRFTVSSLMLEASLPLAGSTEICVLNNTEQECLKFQNPWVRPGRP